MKNKYWEASIPGESKFSLWTLWFSSIWYDETGSIRKKDPNPLNIMLLHTEQKHSEIIKWVKEQKLKLSNWQQGCTEDDIYFQYVYRFKNLNDSMKFKLMWG